MKSERTTTQDMEGDKIDRDAMIEEASENVPGDVPPSFGETVEPMESVELFHDDGQDDDSKMMMLEMLELLAQDDSVPDAAEIVVPSDDDVTSGKGGTRNRPGNIKFREDCFRLAPPFLDNPTPQKKEEVAIEVVNSVYDRGGRFLEGNRNRNNHHQVTWQISAFETALQKTIYCLADVKKEHDADKLNRVLEQARTLGLGDVLNTIAWLNPTKIERTLITADDAALVQLCDFSILSQYPGAKNEATCYSISKPFRAVIQKSRGSPALAMAAIRSHGLDNFSRQDKDTWGSALQMLPHANMLRAACDMLQNDDDDDKVALADVLVQSGHVAMWASRSYDLARQNYEASLDIVKSVVASQQQDSNKHRIATTMKHLGRLYQEMGDYKSAMKWYTQALGVLRANDAQASSLEIARILHFLGRVCFCLGQGPEAKQHFEAALEMKHKVNASATSKALTMANICRILQIDGNYTEALAMYKKIEQMPDVDYRTRFGATTRLCEGQVHQDRGDLPKARRKYEKALEIYDQVFGIQERNDATAMAHSYLGSVLVDMGDLDGAFRHLKLAFDIMKEVFGATAKHDNLANVMYHLGRLYKKRGDDQKAQSFCHYSKAMMIELHGGQDAHQATTVEEHIRRIQANWHFH